MFNKSEIMKRAWEIVKKNPNWRELGFSFWMKRALWQAWGEAKAALKSAAEIARDKVAGEILSINCKRFLTSQDRARLSELRTAA